MPKVIEITVEIKEGLPNYSGRTTTVKVVALEDEDLIISSNIAMIRAQVFMGWGKIKEEKMAPVAAKTDKAVEEFVEEAKAAAESPKPKRGKAAATASKDIKNVKAKDLIEKEDEAFDDDDDL